MKRPPIQIVFIAVLGFLCLSALGTAPRSTVSKASHKALPRPTSYRPAHLATNYGKFPLAFEPNQGQTDPQVQFLSHGSGYTLFVTSQEAVLALKKPMSSRRDHPTKKTWHKGSPISTPDNSAPTILRLRLEGAQSGAKFESQEKLPGVSNYFIGKDRSKWLKGVPQYSKVSVKGLYAGVDMVYYGYQGKLEYDFVVQPGADPGNIHLKIDGAKEVRVNEQGDMELSTEQGKVVFRAPTLYQEVGGIRNPVMGSYKQEEGNRIGFEVKDYDPNKPLVIDPVLDYSTYLGGSGFDWASAIAVDGSGNAYITGYTQSADFPVQNNSQVLAGPQNAVVAELDPTGTTLVFSTYLGGNGDDFGQGIALDTAGDIFVTGYTNSTNFPTAAPLQAALMGNDNVFVSVIGPGGTSLGFSTYLGGSGYDQGMGIAVDGSGNILVTGVTDSPDFPTLNAIQPAIGNANASAFVFKINAGGASAAYSTFLGGNVFDWGSGIAVDGSGNAYIGGYTSSTNFPTVNPFQAALAGNQNAFVTEINSAGNAWAYSTYLGGSNADACYGIALDGSGNIYVAGNTNSVDFPTMNPVQPALLGPNGNAFVTEIAVGGSSLVYSTYLGGSGSATNGDLANCIGVDGGGNACVGGWTTSSDFPTANPIQASSMNTMVTSFVTQIAAGGGSYLFSTYLGGSGQDQGSGIAVDSAGNLFLTGVTNSSDFPTQNPFQSGLAGSVDAYISKIDLTNLTPTPTPTSTMTSTFTPAGTPTFTPTVTATFTPSNTPTATFTFTSTNTPTFTPTATSTFTFTDSPTVTFTFTQTDTPTSTSTPTFTSTVTVTPTQPVVQVALGASPPSNQTVIPGTLNVPVLEVNISNQSGETVQLTGATLTASGTGASSSGVSNMSIYAIVSGSPVLVGQVSFPFAFSTTATIPLPSLNIPALSSQTFLITYDFSPAASPGAYSLSAANSSALSGQGLTSGKSIQVVGAPVNGATLTIANATATFTPTATITNTPVINKVTIGNPYPNPVDGSVPLSIPVIAPTGSNATWTVYTIGFRKIYEQSQPIPGNYGTLSWDLLDKWGVPVSNGLYYISVDVFGLDSGSRIVKVLVTR